MGRSTGREFLIIGYRSAGGIGLRCLAPPPRHKEFPLPLQKIDFVRATRASTRLSVAGMGWPPQVGELLPRAEEAIGVRYKLTTDSLDLSITVADQRQRASR